MPNIHMNEHLEPDDCARCSNRPCEGSSPETLDICIYGVAFFNNGRFIQKKKENVTMRHIAGNLRHELNKIINFVVAQANLIDPTLSSDRIDLNNPASRIIGAAQVLDNFIEMICGVYEFSPDEGMFATNSSSTITLTETTTRLWNAYSLIKNSRRAQDLKCQTNIDPKIKIERLPSVIEYLVAILIDNIWKYSYPSSHVAISTTIKDDHLFHLKFVNFGPPCPSNFSHFSKGSKLDKDSEGFGFGLYWAKILCDHYNRASGRLSDFLEIHYTQTAMPELLITEGEAQLPKTARHSFEILNISYVR